MRLVTLSRKYRCFILFNRIEFWWIGLNPKLWDFSWDPKCFNGCTLFGCGPFGITWLCGECILKDGEN